MELFTIWFLLEDDGLFWIYDCKSPFPELGINPIWNWVSIFLTIELWLLLIRDRSSPEFMKLFFFTACEQ